MQKFQPTLQPNLLSVQTVSDMLFAQEEFYGKEVVLADREFVEMVCPHKNQPHAALKLAAYFWAFLCIKWPMFDRKLTKSWMTLQQMMWHSWL